MAKATEVRETKKGKSPFGQPADDEAIELLIPEGAESGRIPAGDQYIGKLLGLVQGESESSGNPMITWTFTMYDGDFQGMDFNMWTTLTANSMWKLADTLTALGVAWEPGVPLKIRPKELKGTLVRMVIKDDKYEGRERSKLAAILPHPDGAGKKAKAGFVVPSKADEDDEDEKPRKTRKTRDEPEDEDEDERPAKGKRGAPDMDQVWDKGKRRPEPEEEEEERPASRRPRDEDEDEEDERPVRRGRHPKDEDEDDDEPKRKAGRRSRL